MSRDRPNAVNGRKRKKTDFLVSLVYGFPEERRGRKRA